VSVQAKAGSLASDKLPNGASKSTSGGSTSARGVSEAPNGDQSLWDGDDDAFFADEALLAASQGPASASSPNKSNGSASRQNVHDLTGEDEDEDGEPAGAGTRLSEKAKGKRPEEAGSQAPVNYIVTKRADLLAAEGLQETLGEQQWAYWCPRGTVPVLEEQPKWFLLREMLEEIENQIHWTPVSYGRLQRL
jgi:DNA excision repair protein ERCC-4